MATEKEKRIKVYSKNGNEVEIRESLKGSFIGKGYFMDPPKQVPTEEKSSDKEGSE